MKKLSNAELEKYARHTILPEIGVDGQQRLKEASVLIIGAGGLGCPVSQYLSASGVGRLGIVDFDEVSVSNLHRQILFGPHDIGKNKAITIKEKLQFLNPELEIEAYPVRLTAENAAALFETYDLIIDGCDNFKTRYLVNDICVAEKKPWVFGSLFKFEGQVSVFNFENGPVYRDVFPEAPAEGTVPNCAEIGVLATLPGIAGLLMANEAIKVIVGCGESLSGKLMVFNALDNGYQVYQVQEQKKKAVKPRFETMEIEFEEAEKLGDFYLLDVREEWEFEDFNKGGVNIPINFLPKKLGELADHNPIVCCCNYGNQSKIAVKLIKDLYPEKEVYSVKNGIEEC